MHTLAALAGVQPSSKPESEKNQTLSGVPANDTLPDLVLNRTGANTNSGDQELEVANVLLSLGDSLESTVDDADDNADLMPIWGRRYCTNRRCTSAFKIRSSQCGCGDRWHCAIQRATCRP